ncbi:hypothetical protein FB451DRAFT_1186889 [Mycena latifolia]|nr:hypothetical protein FB451DRAFT_1186889 [Mycena latifolia]
MQLDLNAAQRNNKTHHKDESRSTHEAASLAILRLGMAGSEALGVVSAGCVGSESPAQRANFVNSTGAKGCKLSQRSQSRGVPGWRSRGVDMLSEVGLEPAQRAMVEILSSRSGGKLPSNKRRASKEKSSSTDASGVSRRQRREGDIKRRSFVGGRGKGGKISSSRGNGDKDDVLNQLSAEDEERSSGQTSALSAEPENVLPRIVRSSRMKNHWGVRPERQRVRSVGAAKEERVLLAAKVQRS